MHRFCTALSVLAVTAAQSVAQPVPWFRSAPVHNPFYRPEPYQALRNVGEHPQLPTGRLSRMSSGERSRIAGMLDPAMDAVRAQLLNPQSARFTGLRAGVHNDIAVLCGNVSAVGADGVRASERFIARPAAATFETEIGAEAIAAAEDAIGCS